MIRLLHELPGHPAFLYGKTYIKIYKTRVTKYRILCIYVPASKRIGIRCTLEQYDQVMIKY